jgi:hypothetical protein
VEPHGHVEQVVCRVLLVSEDEYLLPSCMGGLVVEPGTDICRTALLAGLEYQHPDPTSVLSGMLFDPRMQVPLHTVEQQRLDLARLSKDLQAASGVVFEVVPAASRSRVPMTLSSNLRMAAPGHGPSLEARCAQPSRRVDCGG